MVFGFKHRSAYGCLPLHGFLAIPFCSRCQTHLLVKGIYERRKKVNWPVSFCPFNTFEAIFKWSLLYAGRTSVVVDLSCALSASHDDALRESFIISAAYTFVHPSTSVPHGFLWTLNTAWFHVDFVYPTSPRHFRRRLSYMIYLKQISSKGLTRRHLK